MKFLKRIGVDGYMLLLVLTAVAGVVLPARGLAAGVLGHAVVGAAHVAHEAACRDRETGGGGLHGAPGAGPRDPCAERIPGLGRHDTSTIGLGIISMEFSNNRCGPGQAGCGGIRL